MFESVSEVAQSRALAVGGRVFALVATMALGMAPAGAQDLKAVMGDLLKTHPRLEAARSDVGSAEAKANDTLRRAWSPNFDLSAESGKQKYESLANDSTLDYQRYGIRATQQLYDFGKSDHQVSETQAVLNQSKALASGAESGLLLEALSAHWSYVRAQKLLGIARQSEESVRRQANIESSMVELGKGYESNVLQAKVQLTSAESRSLRATGALDIAQARIKAVFANATSKVGYDALSVAKPDMLPKTLDEAVKIALQNNQQIQVGNFRSAAIQERISSTNAKEFYPRLNLIAEKNGRKNTDGMSNERMFGDDKLYVQFLYNFNAGGAGQSAVEAVSRDYAASVSRELETRQLVEEQVTIAWRNYQVAVDNRTTLANLVRIAAKFYEMAVAERQLGRRSLLELLSAELSLIGALGDLTSTEADAGIAALTLLQSVGRLDLGSFEMKPVDAVLPKL